VEGLVAKCEIQKACLLWRGMVRRSVKKPILRGVLAQTAVLRNTNNEKITTLMDYNHKRL